MLLELEIQRGLYQAAISFTKEWGNGNKRLIMPEDIYGIRDCDVGVAKGKHVKSLYWFPKQTMLWLQLHIMHISFTADVENLWLSRCLRLHNPQSLIIDHAVWGWWELWAETFISPKVFHLIYFYTNICYWNIPAVVSWLLFQSHSLLLSTWVSFVCSPHPVLYLFPLHTLNLPFLALTYPASSTRTIITVQETEMLRSAGFVCPNNNNNNYSCSCCCFCYYALQFPVI